MAGAILGWIIGMIILTLFFYTSATIDFVLDNLLSTIHLKHTKSVF